MKHLLQRPPTKERPSSEHKGAESWFARSVPLLLTVPGLLCHLFICWLLTFPYTYFEIGICEENCISITTGWQVWSWILILPLLSYLTYLLSPLGQRMLAQGSLGDSLSDLRYFLSLLWQGAQMEQWHEGSLKLNVLVNLVGLLIFLASLQYSSMADLHNVAWRDAAFGIHFTLVLLTACASSVISLVPGFRLQRGRKVS